jgi:putative heme iron utilization protein
MSTSDAAPNDPRTINMGGHGVPVGVGPAAAELVAELPPLVETPAAPLRSAAEEARTILASNVTGALATLTDDGGPWASIVTYGVLADGSPVFSLSTLAAHGRNLRRDQRASLAVSETVPPARDPADSGRVTVAGVAEEPAGARLEEAREVYEAAVASAAIFGGFVDFTWWVLRVERVRWVGGFGRMDSVGPESFADAEADPVAPGAPAAVAHLNADHADALALIARTLSGHTDAEEATCVGADRYGLDLELDTPRGRTGARVGFEEPVREPDGLRAATVAMVARARALG